jgi:hypothetical protein
LIVALQRLQSAPGGNQKLDEALRNLMRLYNRRRRPLRALRLYSVSWALRPGLQGSEPPADANPDRPGDRGRRRGWAMNLRANWHRYWFTPETAEQLALVRVVSYGLLFAIYLPLDDRGWTQVSPVFWMPISLFHLSGPPRDAALIGVLQILWKASLLTSAIGFVSRLSMVTAAALGYFLLGLPNCFGKIHHLDGFPVLLLCILALSRCADALSVDRALRGDRAMRTNVSGQYRWPVRLAQTLFLLVFFAAGYAKLRNGGLAWMTAANMRSIWLGELFTHTPPTGSAAFWRSQSG